MNDSCVLKLIPLIAYELIQVGLLTSVCVGSLKFDGLMDDSCVLKFL